MKVRISYSKTGPIRYVGHLDFMRTVQKIIKRSGIEGSYSKGFSPHYILSFASPLGVGAECKADYFDLELDYRDPFGDGKEDADLPEVPKGEEILGKLNASGIGGVRFNGIRRITPGKASNAMAAVASASYDITFKDIEEGKKVTAALEGFLSETSVVITKKTKKSETQTDIRPMIREGHAEPSGERMMLRIDTGSTNNLKPGAVLQALYGYAGLSYEPSRVKVIREDLFDRNDVSLSMAGEPF